MKSSPKDTPLRPGGLAPPKQDSKSKSKEPRGSLLDAKQSADPFPTSSFGERSDFFDMDTDDLSAGTSDPFFKVPLPLAKKPDKQFDPQQYKTEAGH